MLIMRTINKVDGFYCAPNQDIDAEVFFSVFLKKTKTGTKFYQAHGVAMISFQRLQKMENHPKINYLFPISQIATKDIS